MGRRLVVRNGCHQPRKVTTAAGAIEVKAPRVNDKRVDETTGERKRFSSAILPPWCRKSPKVAEVLPLLSLHGLSPGGFVPAMEQFLGSSAGLSPATATRLTAQWQADHAAFHERDLFGTDYVYVWVDGIHLRIRLDEAKAAVLVVIAVRADGTKDLVATADGYRESSESWAAPLPGLRSPRHARPCARGRRRCARVLEGPARGLPDTREQWCWVHKTANVLDAMPKSAQPAAKKAIQDIYNAEDREHAEQALKTFAKLYGAKFPKAGAKITSDQDVLLEFYDYPAEHWIHLRTTNPIESSFVTVRLRTKVTKGAGSRAAGLAMVFKLVESAQAAGGPSTALTSSHSSGPEPASNAANSSSAPRPARHEPPRPIRRTRVDLRHPCTVCADDRREGRRAAPRAEGCRTRTGSSAQPGTKRSCPPDAGVPDASASRPRACRRPSQ